MLEGIDLRDSTIKEALSALQQCPDTFKLQVIYDPTGLEEQMEDLVSHEASTGQVEEGPLGLEGALRCVCPSAA